MDNLYDAPEAVSQAGSVHPASPPSFSQSSAIYLTIVMALAGACAARAAGLFPILVGGRTTFPISMYAMIWVWLVITGLAACCGLMGGYQCLRKSSAGNPALLVFLLIYSVTGRYDTVSLDWPFQVHVGMVFGNIGLGLNLVGLVLIVWGALRNNREKATSSQGETEKIVESVIPEV